ncbi:MAG TPA: hypothetical protein VKG26_09145 [Bacteroidia bacterium]|nr:hypothetical protein [Bacteroidia bacterium]
MFLYSKIVKLSFVPIICLVCLAGFTSDVAFDELHKLNIKYREMKEYSMDLSYKMFVSHTSTKAEQVSHSHYVKKDKIIYMDIEGLHTLQTEKYLIVVVDKDKKVMVSRPTKDVVNQTKIEDIEKSLNQTSTLKMTEEGNSRVFNVKFKPGAAQYEKINIYENKKEGLIDKMVFYLGINMKLKPEDPSCKEDKPRMEVYYENVKLQSDVDPILLEESHYIKKKGSDIELSSYYKNYKLINNYLKN